MFSICVLVYKFKNHDVNYKKFLIKDYLLLEIF
jgi:hypothetical protein